MTRWWWFGGGATPEEITRELTLMSESGLRGVELQPVYPLEVDDPKRRIRNIRYLSAEWFDLLRHTTEETRRLGMQFDLTLGSGWPYGGPFIPIELAARTGSNLPATEVQLRLAPYESSFVVFSATGNGPAITHTNWPGPLKIEIVGDKTQVTGLIRRNGEYFLTDAAGKTHRFEVRGMPEPIALNGPWRLTLGEKSALTLAPLQSWNDLPEGKDYSGWGVYETDFELTSLGEQLEWALDLGIVHETAEVVLNGIGLGSAWKGSRILPCGNALKVGTNHLKVEVGNLWIHHVQSLPKPNRKALAETFGIRWGTYGEIKPARIPPSGLLGPVQLVPGKKWGSTL
jgi:hypothetical protein